jgi:hypothetical protein
VRLSRIADSLVYHSFLNRIVWPSAVVQGLIFGRSTRMQCAHCESVTVGARDAIVHVLPIRFVASGAFPIRMLLADERNSLM